MKAPARRLSTAALSLLCGLFATNSLARASARDVIPRALRDELKRSSRELKIKGYESPCYISYTVRDGVELEVIATLGSLVVSQIKPFRSGNHRMMMGDYHRNDENFFDFDFGRLGGLPSSARAIPLDDDYAGVRRSLWLTTDNLYKNVIETFDRKRAAVSQQQLSGKDLKLDDFSPAPVVKYTSKPLIFDLNKAEWESVAKELSAIFVAFPDVQNSQVRISISRTDVYQFTSEGTEVIQPVTLASIEVSASSQADDGEFLHDQMQHYANVPGELPPLASLKDEVVALAEELVALRTAPVFGETYSGPVLLEGQAVAELFAQRLLKGTGGLVAWRRPFVADPRAAQLIDFVASESLEDRIGQRIASKSLSIKATPTLSSLGTQALIGSYSVDAEGVKPPRELVLVKDGILKSLLSTRTPTQGVQKSNGHSRSPAGPWGGHAAGPSVTIVSMSGGLSANAVRAKFLDSAREEGLDHVLIVRKISPTVSFGERDGNPGAFFGRSSRPGGQADLTSPILVFMVNVKDGTEQLVRSAKIGSLPLSALKHLGPASKDTFVYNTLLPSQGSGPSSMLGGGGGLPVKSTLVVPASLVLEEIEVAKASRSFSGKRPVVASPLIK